MSKNLTITIHNETFPKIFDYDENRLNKIIMYLLNIGYQQTFISISEENVVNKVDGICRKFKDDILDGIQEKNNSINTNISKLDNTVKDLNMDNKIDEFNEIIHKLFGISSTSSKKGEISEPVKTDFGWHVIKLNNIRNLTTPPLEEVRAEIFSKLQQQFVAEQIKKFRNDSLIIFQNIEHLDTTVLRNTNFIDGR